MDQNEETEPNEETEDIYKELDPREVAGDFMHELVNLCSFECMPKPDEEDVLYRVLDYCYSRCDIDPEVDVAIKKSKTFRDELEKELREMLNDYWARTLAINVEINLLEPKYRQIVDNKELSNSSKAELLKSYVSKLEEFAYTIKHALQEKKPLRVRKLYYWLKELNDFAFEPDYELFPDWLQDYYDTLDDYGRLWMLSDLLDVINEWLSKIKQKLSELEGLKNEDKLF